MEDAAMKPRKKTPSRALPASGTAGGLPPALYREIVERSTVGILVLDARGEILFANAAISALTGRDDASLCGHTLADIVPDADVADLLRLPPTDHHGRDVKFRRADGNAVWTLCTVSALATKAETPTEWLLTVNDISTRKHTEDALRASEHRLRALVDNEPECVKLMDADGRLLHINQAGLHMIGADKIDDVLGKSVYGLIDPKDRDGYRNLHLAVARGGTGCIQFEIVNLKGARRWLETTVAPFPGEEGRAWILGITRDITERRHAEAALRNSEELLRHVLQTLPVGVWVFDAQQRVLMDNPAGTALLADARIDASVQQACQRAVAAALTTGAVVHNDIVEYDAPAGRKTILHSAVPIRDTAGKVLGAVAVKQDISDYRHAQERIHFLASYDPLTGLANRRLFTQRLQAALTAAGAGGTVLLVDLDRFKTVNESLGHAAGDELLRAMAQRLGHYLRTDDTLAYLSGDEFGVLMPGIVALKEVEALADTLLRAIAEPVHIGGREFFVSGSMGIALYPRDGSEPTEVLRHADVALYRAKAQGRGTYRLYAQTPRKAALDRLDLERELRRAIERQEFVLHYQPQLDIRSNRIVGAEALVRWNHGKLGVVSPAQFIPLAEETGLIVPLSEWILDEACRQGSAWRGAGLDRLRIAVNMSGFSFKSGGPKRHNIARVIEEILARTGLGADELEIELTESMLMHDVAETLQLLADLSALGVHLAIDDFGIGYSSLNYLKRFPIDVLKIDQSFVGDLARDPNDAAIVSAIIGLAHTLDLCVVAEGVETATQLQFLRDRRCDLYQGYLAARPLAADVFAAHLREHKSRHGA